jgi:hypothetical protein
MAAAFVALVLAVGGSTTVAFAADEAPGVEAAADLLTLDEYGGYVDGGAKDDVSEPQEPEAEPVTLPIADGDPEPNADSEPERTIVEYEPDNTADTADGEASLNEQHDSAVVLKDATDDASVAALAEELVDELVEPEALTEDYYTCTPGSTCSYIRVFAAGDRSGTAAPALGTQSATNRNVWPTVSGVTGVNGVTFEAVRTTGASGVPAGTVVTTATTGAGSAPAGWAELAVPAGVEVRVRVTETPHGWSLIGPTATTAPVTGTHHAHQFIATAPAQGQVMRLNNAHLVNQANSAALSRANASGMVPLVRDNRSLTARCGQLRIALLADYSNSMTNTMLLDQRDAMTAFTTALTGTSTVMSLYTFGTNSPFNNNSANEVRNVDLATNASAITAVINRLPVQQGIGAAGGTNWDEGLNRVRSSAPYDLVVFITDGNPTYHQAGTSLGGPGSETRPVTLEAAVAAANALKDTGARIFGVGVPATAGETAATALTNNLRAISGTSAPGVIPDLVTYGNFAQVSSSLQNLANALCGASVSVRMNVVDATVAATDHEAIEQQMERFEGSWEKQASAPATSAATATTTETEVARFNYFSTVQGHSWPVTLRSAPGDFPELQLPGMPGSTTPVNALCVDAVSGLRVPTGNIAGGTGTFGRGFTVTLPTETHLLCDMVVHGPAEPLTATVPNAEGYYSLSFDWTLGKTVESAPDLVIDGVPTFITTGGHREIGYHVDVTATPRYSHIDVTGTVRLSNSASYPVDLVPPVVTVGGEQATVAMPAGVTQVDGRGYVDVGFTASLEYTHPPIAVEIAIPGAPTVSAPLDLTRVNYGVETDRSTVLSDWFDSGDAADGDSASEDGASGDSDSGQDATTTAYNINAVGLDALGEGSPDECERSLDGSVHRWKCAYEVDVMVGTHRNIALLTFPDADTPDLEERVDVTVAEQMLTVNKEWVIALGDQQFTVSEAALRGFNADGEGVHDSGLAYSQVRGLRDGVSATPLGWATPYGATEAQPIAGLTWGTPVPIGYRAEVNLLETVTVPEGCQWTDATVTDTGTTETWDRPIVRLMGLSFTPPVWNHVMDGPLATVTFTNTVECPTDMWLTPWAFGDSSVSGTFDVDIDWTLEKSITTEPHGVSEDGVPLFITTGEPVELEYRLDVGAAPTAGYTTITGYAWVTNPNPVPMLPPAVPVVQLLGQAPGVVSPISVAQSPVGQLDSTGRIVPGGRAQFSFTVTDTHERLAPVTGVSMEFEGREAFGPVPAPGHDPYVVCRSDVANAEAFVDDSFDEFGGQLLTPQFAAQCGPDSAAFVEPQADEPSGQWPFTYTALRNIGAADDYQTTYRNIAVVRPGGADTTPWTPEEWEEFTDPDPDPDPDSDAPKILATDDQDVIIARQVLDVDKVWEVTLEGADPVSIPDSTLRGILNGTIVEGDPQAEIAGFSWVRLVNLAHSVSVDLVGYINDEPVGFTWGTGTVIPAGARVLLYEKDVLVPELCVYEAHLTRIEDTLGDGYAGAPTESEWHYEYEREFTKYYAHTSITFTNVLTCAADTWLPAEVAVDKYWSIDLGTGALEPVSEALLRDPDLAGTHPTLTAAQVAQVAEALHADLHGEGPSPWGVQHVSTFVGDSLTFSESVNVGGPCRPEGAVVAHGPVGNIAPIGVTEDGFTYTWPTEFPSGQTSPRLFVVGATDYQITYTNHVTCGVDLNVEHRGGEGLTIRRTPNWDLRKVEDGDQEMAYENPDGTATFTYRVSVEPLAPHIHVDGEFTVRNTNTVPVDLNGICIIPEFSNGADDLLLTPLSTEVFLVRGDTTTVVPGGFEPCLILADEQVSLGFITAFVVDQYPIPAGGAVRFEYTFTFDTSTFGGSQELDGSVTAKAAVSIDWVQLLHGSQATTANIDFSTSVYNSELIEIPGEMPDDRPTACPVPGADAGPARRCVRIVDDKTVPGNVVELGWVPWSWEPPSTLAGEPPVGAWYGEALAPYSFTYSITLDGPMRLLEDTTYATYTNIAWIYQIPEIRDDVTVEVTQVPPVGGEIPGDSYPLPPGDNMGGRPPTGGAGDVELGEAETVSRDLTRTPTTVPRLALTGVSIGVLLLVVAALAGGGVMVRRHGQRQIAQPGHD